MKQTSTQKHIYTDEQILYLKTGYCDHSTLVKSKIPNCNIILTNCKVCAKEFDRQRTPTWIDKRIPEALTEHELIDRSLLL